MIINDWKELSEIPNESDTHKLVVDLDRKCAHLYAKDRKDYDPKIDYLKQVAHLDHYLNTHAFRKRSYKWYSEVLKTCGFDVDLVNQDALVQG